MELIIFAVFLTVALMLLFANRVFPHSQAVILTAGFMILILGMFMIGDGLSIGSSTLKTAFTEKIGLMFSLFGTATNMMVVF
jgi:hypothetical protein